MASLFEKGFNKFADMGNALNKEANKLVGKEVFGEIKKIEEPKVFPPFESYPPCTVEEPEQWTALTGNSKQFELDGNIINVSQELDTCFQYKDLFKQSAQYYANRFEFRYHQCVKDYDTLLHYFEDMYMEGLAPMATAYGRDTYKHVLHLKCAPLEDVTNRYHMGYYNIEKVLPFEEWEFPEYIEYQTTLRKTITESSYADPVDWWFQAFSEVAGIRFTHIRENR